MNKNEILKLQETQVEMQETIEELRKELRETQAKTEVVFNENFVCNHFAYMPYQPTYIKRTDAVRCQIDINHESLTRGFSRYDYQTEFSNIVLYTPGVIFVNEKKGTVGVYTTKKMAKYLNLKIVKTSNAYIN